MTPKHTQGNLEIVGAKYLWITGENGAAIAIIAEPECKDSSDIHPVTISSKRWDEATANAARLAHCWNTHHIAVDALEKALQWLPKNTPGAIVNELRFALATSNPRPAPDQ